MCAYMKPKDILHDIAVVVGKLFALLVLLLPYLLVRIVGGKRAAAMMLDRGIGGRIGKGDGN